MNNVENRFITLVAIIYCVGIAGFMIPSLNATFMWLTPTTSSLHLFLRGSSTKMGSQARRLDINRGCFGIFLEYAGVTTGKIFGSYHYGRTLGTGWQGVPYLIGLNWAALIFSPLAYWQDASATLMAPRSSAPAS